MIIMVFMVIMIVLAILDRVHRANRLVHGDTISFGVLDHVEKALFEGCTVDDQRCSLSNLCDLLSRCLEVVGVCAYRHHREDVRLIADEILDHVSENVCRDRDGRCVDVGRGVAIAPAPSGDKDGRGERSTEANSQSGGRHDGSKSENQYHLRRYGDLTCFTTPTKTRFRAGIT